MASGGRWPPHWLFHGLVVLVHTIVPPSTWLGASLVVIILCYAAQGAVLCWLLMRQVGVIVAILHRDRCTDHHLHVGRHPLFWLPQYGVLAQSHPRDAQAAGDCRDGIRDFPPFDRARTLARGRVVRGNIDQTKFSGVFAAGERGRCHPEPVQAPWRPRSWYLPLALVLPTVLVLLWQFLAYFGTGSNSGIVFAPCW